MSLDLENIQWQEDNLTDTDYGTGSRVHDGLAVALAECAVEAVTVVVGEVVAYEGLSAELVYSLEDLFLSVRVPVCLHFSTHLVCGGISETGEQ